MPSEIEEALEALLFAAGEPCSVSELAGALQVETADVERALRVLAQRSATRGVCATQVAGRWQLRTAPRFGPAISRLRGSKPRALSRGARRAI